MMKRFFFIAQFCLAAVMSFAQEEFANPSLEQIKACGLPVVLISTVNEEEPYSELVYAPPGENGISLCNKTKVPGSIAILNGNDTIYFSGEYVDGESGMTLRHRGNTSAQWPKKPFKIKLQKKADLLCRGEERFKDKEWLLMTGYNLHIPIGLKINELMGFSWTPQYRCVNVFINGNYRGIYSLFESVKRNADCRLDVDKNEGYIFECDPYWWNEDVHFTTSLGKHFTFKYPDDEDVTSEQMAYLSDYMNHFEQSLDDGTYDDYIDTESFARWLLARDILGNADGAGANLFLTKYDGSSKVEMSTLWDFDMDACVPAESFSAVHSCYFYYPLLFDNKNSNFVRTYKRQWESLMPALYDELKNSMYELATSDAAKQLADSYKYEQERWHYYDADTLITDFNNFFDYYDKHIAWLDGAINSIECADGITTVAETGRKDSDRVYSITGQIVNPSRRGIYIKGGRKIILR